MDKVHLIYIVAELKIGNYTTCLKYIKEKKLIVENETQKIKLNLLYAITNGLSASSDAAKEVINMLELINFKYVDNDNRTPYLQCFPHILNYVVNSSHIALVKDLSPYIKPPIISYTELTDTQLTCFQCIGAILRNNISLLLKINCELTINAYLKIVIDVMLISDSNIKKIESVFLFLISKEYSCDNLMKLSTYFLETQKMMDGNFNELATLLCTLCKNCLMWKKYDAAKGFWLVFREKLVRCVSEGETEILDDILRKFYMLFDFETPDFFEALTNVKDLGGTYMNFLIPTMVLLLKEFVKADIMQFCEQNELIVALFNICNEFKVLASRIEYNCCCKISYDISTVVNVMIIEGYVYNYLACSKCVGDVTLVAGLTNFNKTADFLDIMRKNNCKFLERAWGILGETYYKIGVQLYHTNNPFCYKYLQTCTKAAIKLESTRKSFAKKTLCVLTKTRLLNKCFQEALHIAALQIYLYPDDNNDGQRQWVNAKHGSGGEFEDSTIVSVLNENQGLIKKKYYENFKIITDSKIKVQLLTIELEAYNKQWTYMIPKHLIKLSQYTDCSRLLSQIDYYSLIGFEQRFCREVLDSCIEKLKQNCNLHLHYGYLLFLKYKFVYNELIVKCNEELESCKLLASNEDKMEENKMSDVNPGYYYLRINACSEVLNLLLEACKYLKLGTENVAAINAIDKKELTNLIIGFTDLAYEFKLHCDIVSFLDAMFATLKLAEVFDDFELVLRIKTGLMQHLSVDSQTFLSLKSECAKVIKQHYGDELTSEDECLKSNSLHNEKAKQNVHQQKEYNKLTILCRYYTSLSLAYTHTSDIETANKFYKQATSYYNRIDLSEENSYGGRIEVVRYVFLAQQLANTECEYSKIFYKHDTLSSLYTSYYKVFHVFKIEKRVPPELLSVSLEAIEALLTFYISVRLPREVHVYGIGVIDLIQKLVLPFWVVKLTIYLARADMLHCKFVDCEVKLEKVSNILGLSSENISKVATIRANPEIYPNFIKSTIRIPECLNHTNNCSCIACESVVYKDLLMQKINLDALLFEVHDDPKTALELFKAVSDIFKRVISNPTYLCLNTEFYNSTYNQYMLDYIRFKWKLNETQDATLMCGELITKMDSEFYKNQHVYNEAVNMLSWLLVDKFDIVVIPKINFDKTPMKEKPMKSTPSPILRSPLAMKSLRKQQRVHQNNFLTPDTTAPRSRLLKMTQKNLLNDLKDLATPKIKEAKSVKKGKQLKVFCDSEASTTARPTRLRRFLDDPATPQPVKVAKSPMKVSKSTIKPAAKSKEKLLTEKPLFITSPSQKTDCMNGISSFNIGTSNGPSKSSTVTGTGTIRKYSKINKENESKPQRGRPKKLLNPIEAISDKLKPSDVPNENINTKSAGKVSHIPTIKLSDDQVNETQMKNLESLFAKNTIDDDMLKKVKSVKKEMSNVVGNGNTKNPRMNRAAVKKHLF